MIAQTRLSRPAVALEGWISMPGACGGVLRMVTEAVVNEAPSIDPSFGVTSAYMILFLSKYCAPSSVAPVYTSEGPVPVSTYQSTFSETVSPSTSFVLVIREEVHQVVRLLRATSGTISYVES